MVKLLDNSARHGSCRWLPYRFTLTSGLDSADPDDSRQHSDSCDFKNGIRLSASVDLASSCPLWPHMRDQPAGESSGVENTNHGGDGAISRQASSRAALAALLMRMRRGRGRGKRMQPPSNTAITRSAGAQKATQTGEGGEGFSQSPSWDFGPVRRLHHGCVSTARRAATRFDQKAS